MIAKLFDLIVLGSKISIKFSGSISIKYLCTGILTKTKSLAMAMQVPTNVDPEQIKSVRDFVTSYNKLIETCFIDCINEFTTRDVKAKEETCALNCMEKYLKMNQRISQRFEEFQMLANENVLAAQKKITEGKKS